MLEFRVLGPLEIGSDDGPARVSGRKERAVLAALLVDPGRARPAEELVAAVWGEDAPPTAEKSLQVRLSHLRAALKDGRELLVRDGRGYRLSIDPAAVDAIRFAALVDEAATLAPADALARYDEALALLRGRPYADVEEFAGLAHEVRRLDELRLRAIEGRMRALLDLGRHAEALPELDRLVRDEPHHEALAGLLMLALYRAGRQVDALAAYRQAAERLRDLGLEPSEDLRRIEGQILLQADEVAAPAAPAAAAPPAVAVPRTNLHARLTSFVGRAPELEDLRARLRTERLITLLGPGGVGKTSLAVEAVRALVDEHSDGVWVVSLATLTGPDQIPTVIADALPFGAAGPNLRGEAREAIDALGERLGGRDVLLVLDDCEHLAAAVARIAERVLRASAGLRILATSRQALGAEGEAIVEVPPFEPGGDDALRLFVERARAVNPQFVLDDPAREAATTIARRLDGLPLALELAAARVRALPVQEIAARLDDRFALLGDVGSGGTRRSLGQVVDWSFGLLTEAEQELFCRLAVFRAPFPVAAAERVAGGGVVDRARVADLLVALVDRSMLASDEGRFGMLETLREFGLLRLEERDGLEGARRRHAGWASALAEAHAGRLYAEGIDAVRHELAPHRADLDVAVELALDEADGDRALPLATALGILDFGLGDSTRARTRLARAVRLEARPGALVPALTVQSLLLTLHGLVEPGLNAVERALSLVGEGDARWRDRALACRGTARLLGGDVVGALEDLDGLEDRFTLRGETWIRGVATGWEAFVRLVLGELVEAQRLSRRAVRSFEVCSDVWGLLSASVNLARVDVALGAYDDAAEVLERAVQAGEARVPGRLGPLLHDYGLVEMRRERSEHAEALWRRCVELGERQAMSGGWVLLTGPAERWYAVMADGHLARTDGDWDRARGRYSEAAALLEAVEREERDTIGINAAIATSLVSQGEVTEPDEAVPLLRSAIARAMASGDRRLVARVMEALAQAGDDPVLGAELLGAADAVRMAAGGPRPPIERRAIEAVELALRATLGDAAYDEAAQRGRTDPLAVAYAAR